MPDGRPAIPSDLERQILVEAGHRCAIPTCRTTPVEMAHIVPWSRVREHRFENLIALCPTCHSRFDRGDIDRKAMLIYKQSLSRQESISSLLRANRLATYLEFMRVIDLWSNSVGDIAHFDVADEGKGDQRDALTQACTAAAIRAKQALISLTVTYERETAWKAEGLYGAVLSLANDVVDGLWPSTHPGADQHDDIPEAEEELLLAVAEGIGMSSDDLSALTSGYDLKLGGTGKRF